MQTTSLVVAYGHFLMRTFVRGSTGLSWKNKQACEYHSRHRYRAMCESQTVAFTVTAIVLSLEKLFGEALLRLEAVVLTARHGKRDADARFDVQELAQRGEAVGVDE